jgi:hypothetical protein
MFIDGYEFWINVPFYCCGGKIFFHNLGIFPPKYKAIHPLNE